jgi:MerR family transcriptional regulator, Zn(II)-responsive regulator of zntA
VSADTLRAYERRGLLPEARRAANGYRLYPPEALRRVEMIQSGLAFGFTLSELGRFLDARRAGRPPCREVRDAAKKRLSEIEDALAELRTLRGALARLVRDWGCRIEGESPLRPLHLLETLPRSAARRAGAALSARRFSRAPGTRPRK